MTPTQIINAARNKYNAIGDSFYSDQELLDLLYEGCLDLTKKVPDIIEAIYSTTSVASQQEYDFPTNTIKIKRITYAGRKLKPITMREDDSITGLNQASTSEGTPQYYFVWNNTISLRPIPSTSSDTIKIYSLNEPAALTISSTLEIPTQFHMDLVNFILTGMCAKDSNANMLVYYEKKWSEAVNEAKKWVKKTKRGDSFAAVQDEDSMFEGYLGTT